jgi:hypothetical protein
MYKMKAISAIANCGTFWTGRFHAHNLPSFFGVDDLLAPNFFCARLLLS